MPKIISVYFNGSDESKHVPKQGVISLATLLDKMTVKNDRDIFSICVNGCGIETQDRRDLGVVFAFHLEKQVRNIAKQIEEMIQTGEDVVTVNIYGFSRGGVAAFLLCQMLKHVSSDRLKINVAAFDPVPGNFIMSVYGDLLLGTQNTLSAEVADLTKCRNITNLLMLYANQPLPDIVCHAPILPTYPTTCETEIDVTPGCHKGAVAFYKKDNLIEPVNKESAIVFHRIVEFMQKCGTTFNFDKIQLNKDLIVSKELKLDQNERAHLLSLYEGLVAKKAFFAEKRAMHLHNTIFASQDKKYLNRYHQKILQEESINDKDCLLTIDKRNPERISAKYLEASKFVQLAMLIAMVWIIYRKFAGEENQYRLQI